MKLGAQLYTVRDYCKDLDGFSETLQRVAEMGYKTVQVSGTCEYEAHWLKNELDKAGLKCAITHYPIEKMTASPESTMETHEIIGCNNIGIGYYDIDKEGLKSFCDTFLPISRKFAEKGFRLCYHNHYHEFKKINGVTVLEQMAQSFSPDELKFTVDTYWVQRAGADPIKWLRMLSGRIPCVHLKDMAYNSDMAVIGEGNMNWDGILEACADSGTEYLLVEQDLCYGEDPFECLKRSYDYLHAMGIE